MNRKVGCGVVTTTDLVCVDKRGRTARHIEGRVRVDYMNSGHFWVIIDNVVGFGDSMPMQKAGFQDFHEGQPIAPEDVGQLWIPDHMVASIRWYKQEW